MKVLQNKVLIINPYYKQDNKTIQLTDNQKREVMLAELEKCKEVTVYKAGDACSVVKEGDKVYIDIPRLMSLSRVVLKIEGKEQDFFIARESDIDIIY